MSSPAIENYPIKPKEAEELRRVYDQLCLYADKAETFERLRDINYTLTEYSRPPKSTMKQRNLSLSSGFDGNETDGNNVVNYDEKVEPNKTKNLEEEKKRLQAVLDKICSRPVQHIRPEDTAAALKALGKKMTKKEIHDMMWEVDEKLDGVIDWDEFHLSYGRNIRDESGLEPASFYHVIQFMIYDSDNNGLVSIDETMSMLYSRLGRDQMETTITKLFGNDNGAPLQEVGHQGGEIDFTRYWDVVVKEQMRHFNESDFSKFIVEKNHNKRK